MAYLVITANGEEIERRELKGDAALTIGRAPDCDWQVRDIMMSRKHCRLEPTENGGWAVVDLGSKNGTFLAGHPIKRHVLKHGEELRIGRVRIGFRTDAYVASPVEASFKKRNVVRPSDPNEALAGTVSGFTLAEPGEVEYQKGMPVPRPKPVEPKSYATDVAPLVNNLASSSWDSIYAQASQPVNKEKTATKTIVGVGGAAAAIGGVGRSQQRVSFSLQAGEQTNHEDTETKTRVMKVDEPEIDPLGATLDEARPGRGMQRGIT